MGTFNRGSVGSLAVSIAEVTPRYSNASPPAHSVHVSHGHTPGAVHANAALPSPPIGVTHIPARPVHRASRSSLAGACPTGAEIIHLDRYRRTSQIQGVARSR